KFVKAGDAAEPPEDERKADNLESITVVGTARFEVRQHIEERSGTRAGHKSEQEFLGSGIRLRIARTPAGCPVHRWQPFSGSIRWKVWFGNQFQHLAVHSREMSHALKEDHRDPK